MKSHWISAGVIGGLLMTAILGAAAGIRINLTESMPRGVWLARPFNGKAVRGETVAVCLPRDTLTQRYVMAGSCDSGLAPVLKTIEAVAGDTVELSADGARVNGLLLENTAPLLHDDFGQMLPAWPFGTYVVAADEVWLLSGYSSRSFDSRYTGPVLLHRIIARGVPVLVWK